MSPTDYDVRVDVRAVLTKARERYAEKPDHAPFGTPSFGRLFGCPVVLLDRCGDDGTAQHELFVAVDLEPDEGTRDDRDRERVAIIKWNAEATTEEVLGAFDRAIEAAQ